MKKLLIAISLLFLCAQTHAQQRNVYLYASMTGKHLLSYGDSTWIWGYGYYSGSQTSPITLPAPLLTVYTGDTLNLHFKNLTGELHTIHLHGTDVDTRNDGSPHTWPAVAPGDSNIYLWSVVHPGSYFYHCHVMTPLHLGVGMYGMIVAKNGADTTLLYPGGPGFNKTYTYCITDMDTAWNNHPLSPGLLNGFQPNYFMINGYSDWMMFNRPGQIIEANAGDSICVHLGNIGYTTARITFPAGSNATVYQSDARILPTPFATDTLRIYPGERYEVILRPTTFINDWIQVTYLNAILDDSLYTNYIGINQSLHPTGVMNPEQEIQGTIYPNPTNTYFFLELEQPGAVEVFGNNGQLVQLYQGNKGLNQFDCSGLNAGFYYVAAENKVQKLVVVQN